MEKRRIGATKKREKLFEKAKKQRKREIERAHKDQRVERKIWWDRERHRGREKVRK